MDAKLTQELIHQLKFPGPKGVRLRRELAEHNLELLSVLGELLEERKHRREALRKLRVPNPRPLATQEFLDGIATNGRVSGR